MRKVEITLRFTAPMSGNAWFSPAQWQRWVMNRFLSATGTEVTIIERKVIDVPAKD